jgi:hypothetical protein
MFFPFIDLGVTTDLKSVGDLQWAKSLRSSGCLQRHCTEGVFGDSHFEIANKKGTIY